MMHQPWRRLLLMLMAHLLMFVPLLPSGFPTPAEMYRSAFHPTFCDEALESKYTQPIISTCRNVAFCVHSHIVGSCARLIFHISISLMLDENKWNLPLVWRIVGTRLVMVLLKHSYLNLGFMFKATMVRVRSKLRNIPSRLSSCQFFFQPYNQSHHSLEHDDTYDCFVLPFFIIIANHAGYTGTARYEFIVTSHTSRCAYNCSATYGRMSCYISASQSHKASLRFKTAYLSIRPFNFTNSTPLFTTKYVTFQRIFIKLPQKMRCVMLNKK